MADFSSQEVRELLDKQAIHEALMHYCRGIDRCDEDLIRSAYHP
jgi:SnoaL-like domain